MIAGLSGTLLSRQFAEHGMPVAFSGSLGEEDRERGRRQLRAWWRARAAALGPAASIRALFDHGAAPLLSILGWTAQGVRLAGPEGPGVARLASPGGAEAALLVCPWEAELGRRWRDAVHEGIRLDVRWCFVFNGPRIRLVDAERTFARRHIEFDLALAACHDPLFAAIWGVAHARALARPVDTTSGASIAERIFQASDAHHAGVRDALGRGVEAALARLLAAAASTARGRTETPAPADALFEQALVVIYRILFLLFAEARGLVPVWHPLYRASYSVETLGRQAERDGDARGLWEALDAITRLAGRGCEAGDLRVTPFNGRLFARSATALIDGRPRRRRRHRTVDHRDAPLRDVLLTLTTRDAGLGGRERISYADLGVEQLGAVYERVLDYAPAVHEAAGGVKSRPVGRRKATGSFYTPRALTDYLVRRTLHPLVDGAPPDAILSLRVLDPAMGSGAFLVAACRHLASAYEAALVRTGARTPGDLTTEDRAGFRRIIAQRCLYGVDANPMAVQLGRLSLWLATLASDRPLTFLDHNLRSGDSLAGAAIEDILRQPPPRRGGRARAPLPLFDPAPFEAALEHSVWPRVRIAGEPGDDLEAVRAKERLLDRLSAADAPLARWRAVADLWCAASFWPDRAGAPRVGEFWALADRLLGGRSPLPAHVAESRLTDARRVAAGRRFFHWRLEFPEAFYDERGHTRAAPGFDAIIGNPPWEMLRADHGPAADRASIREAAGGLQRFARASGTYRLQGDGHANLYQLFVERALSLTRHAGRVGLVLPFGLATDRGSAALRRALLTRCDTDALISFDNRDGIFPIHRSYRFLLLTTTVGGETATVRCRFGERSADVLDLLPDSGGASAAFPVRLARQAIERIGGRHLAIPELRAPLDLVIAEKAIARARPLGDPNGWAARFGRELNVTDDRRHFGPPGSGLPVLEGKQIRPFVADVAGARQAIPARTAARLLDRGATYGRARLAFRDVASATNARSLIAAIVPAGVVTTHTLLCLKTALDEADQLALCALLNSFVANYLVRQRMGTHVTATIAEHLPVPRPVWGAPAHVALGAAAARLTRSSGDDDAAARIEATAARLYGLTVDEFAHVLASFPLVESAVRDRALEAFRAGRGASSAVL